MEALTHNHDDATAGEVLGLAGGVGILLTQAAALIPGLLPILILLLPLVLPLVLLGLVAGIVVGVPYALWRLLKLALRPLTRHPRRGEARIGAGRSAERVGVGAEAVMPLLARQHEPLA